MLVTELGFATTILIGITLGLFGFAILFFWIQLFSRNFSEESKCFWPLFWIHQLVWMIGVCVVPADLLDSSIGVWGWPFMIYFFGSLIVMAVVNFFGMRD